MKERTKVLMLGTYHFSGGGKHHLINTDVGDILSAKKQREIDELVEKLLLFKPNKIAVEARKEKDVQLNEIYSEYCKRGFLIDNNIVRNRSEIVQLGFRMGKILNLLSIYPLDCPVDLPDDFIKYAKENNYEIYSELMECLKIKEKEGNNYMNNKTVLETFRYLNDSKQVNSEHSRCYLNVAKVRVGNNYYGVDFLAQWYRRNLYIFGNLQDIAEEGDRILLIYGAGHCKILKSFIEQYDRFELVEALQYL